MAKFTRQNYVTQFGPTTGDRFRLADTELVCQIERDFTTPGDELTIGTSKNVRDGMGMFPDMTSAEGVLDLVIINAIILDPILGVIKADIGVKDGRIAGIGKAGNPAIMDNVDPSLIVGAGTEVIDGTHMIATAGVIDAHVHYTTPEHGVHALSNGTTTFVGGGTGPATGSLGTTCTPGPWYLSRMLEAFEKMPVNVVLSGKGNCSKPAALVEQIKAGAAVLKVHEDWGSTVAALDCALSVAEEYGIQVALHADTMNETGFVEDTIKAIGGRTVHTYHTEGAGGGHAPDIIKIAALPNILPSSITATVPYTINTTLELVDMIVAAHNVDPDSPEAMALAESRVRAETLAAETVMQDLGVLSMMSSDAHAMGRVGEVCQRTFQMAHHCKTMRGKLPEDSPAHDNFRVLRYLAKLTINPAITHGLSHEIGSLEKGKLADIVLWDVKWFGTKPSLVIKGGMINFALLGEAGASVTTPQPVIHRPTYGMLGRALSRTCVTFMSQAGIDAGVPAKLGLERRVEAVKNCRSVQKRDMVRNDRLPKIEVDPETHRVTVDGEHAFIEPARNLPLTQLYYLL
ncbi:MAG: urease subunit alpha [Chthoniobacterales bacterium]